MSSKKRSIDEVDGNAIPPAKRRKLNTNNQLIIPPLPTVQSNHHNNQELIPCDYCNNIIPFNEYVSHSKSHQISDSNNNNKNKNKNNDPIVIPCEFESCKQLILAHEYSDHIQLHRLQNVELLNINSNHNINNNHNNNNHFEFKEKDISHKHDIEDIAFWLTKPASLNNKQFSLSLSDIINTSSASTSTSIISKCIFFNYIVDVQWLFNACPLLKNKNKVENIYIFHGETGANHINNLPLNITSTIKKVKIPFNIKFGTHHSKMILLLYKNEGIRVVITTANIIASDWLHKTNGIYLQDFPFKNPKNDNECECDFQVVLSRYLDSLIGEDGNKIMDFSFIQQYDFSSAKCLLIPSVPRYHKYKYINYYGHMRLRYLLSKYNVSNKENDSTIGCVSSLGSLNEKWVINELYQSMGGNDTCDPFKLIWPTVNDIRNSIEGYMAGGSVCFSNKNYLKMQWLRNKYFYKWNGAISNRMRLIPHIKSYCSINKKDKSLNYFILTSANLSKAAWGCLQKDNQQLFIRSYEMGCLFIPEFYDNYLKHQHKGFCLNDLPHANMKRNLLQNNDNDRKMDDKYENTKFEILYQLNKDKQKNESKNIIFPIPMEVIDVQKYSLTDKPWVSDLTYDQPDVYGLTWPPRFNLFG